MCVCVYELEEGEEEEVVKKKVPTVERCQFPMTKERKEIEKKIEKGKERKEKREKREKERRIKGKNREQGIRPRPLRSRGWLKRKDSNHNKRVAQEKK